MVVFVAYIGYLYYPIYIEQKKFYVIQSKIQIGMKKEAVRALTNNLGVLKYMKDQTLQADEEVYYFANFLLPDAIIIKYDQNELVESIMVDQ